MNSKEAFDSSDPSDLSDRTDQLPQKEISEKLDDNLPEGETSPDPNPSDLSDRTDSPAEQEISRMSRRSFLWMAVALAAVLGGWRWLITRSKENGAAWPFRRALEFNESVWRGLSSRNRLSPVFSKSQVQTPRPNGRLGLEAVLNLDFFSLRLDALGRTKELSIDDVTSMPATDVVTELRCIEGWSRIIHWTGIPLADFLRANLGEVEALPEYLYAETPEPDPGVDDEKYFVALERECYLHPQTLLCWAMNGKPLESIHGAPLRLVVPTKYGIKSLKRVRLIRLTDVRPTDYWYERGYDWYAGH